MAGRGTDIILGGNAEFLATAEMKKMQYPEEIIAEAKGFAETEDEEILEARKVFRELEDKYKEQIKGEADKVREVGGLFILARSATIHAVLITSSEAVQAVRAIPVRLSSTFQPRTTLCVCSAVKE